METMIYSGMIGLAITLVFFLLPGVVGPMAHNLATKRREYYDTQLDKLHAFGDTSRFYQIMELSCAAAGAILLLVFFRNIVFGLVGGGIGYLAPMMFIQKKMQARKARFEYQLPDALTAISSSIKAGLSLVQALEQAAEKMPVPISQEFSLIVRQYRMGIPLDDALHQAQERLKSRNFGLACNALIINRERGGDLSEILERISSSVRELYRLEEKIRTETAGPRFEARIMLFVPPFILFLFYLVQPELVGKMFHTPIGILMTLLAIGMMAMAYFWIEKILGEDI